MLIYRVGLVLGLVLGCVLPVSAQEPDCTGLAEADCALLQATFENMRQPFNIANFTLDLGGFGGTSTGNELAVAGSGAVLVAETGAITALHLEVEGGMNEEARTGEVIWRDKVLYLGTADESGNLTWTGTATDDEGGQILGDVLSGQLFYSTLSQPGIATLTRLADVEANGQTMAVFQADVDLVNLLSTEPMLQLLQAVFASAPEGDLSAMGGNDLSGIIRLLGAFMSNRTVQLVLWIGEDDQLVHHLEANVDILMNAPTLGEVGLTANLMADLDQHGGTFEVAAPDDFTEQTFDLASLFGATIGAGLGGGSTDQADDNTVEQPLAYDETVTGTLDSSNSRDVWGLEAQAGDVITITLQAVDVRTGLDTVVMLLDANGDELAFNDDHFGEVEGLDVFDSQLANFSIPADGEYRIIATWQSPVRDAAEYELTVTRQ